MHKELTLAQPGDLVFARCISLKQIRERQAYIYEFGIVLQDAQDGTVLIQSLVGSIRRCYGPHDAIIVPEDALTAEALLALQDGVQRWWGRRPVQAA